MTDLANDTKPFIPAFMRKSNEVPDLGAVIGLEPLGRPKGRLIQHMTSAERKEFPMATGLLDYFPDALAAVAKISKLGNDKHNPGEPLHHARGKSMDHADCIMRHLTERGGKDPEGNPHSAQLAWRALALLQEELEQLHHCALPRAARLPDGK